MRMVYRVGLVMQAIFYVVAGVNHFWHTAMYVSIMPPHYTHPVGLVQLSGVAEILGGIGLLVPWSRRVAAWGIVAMLVVYFDVHVYMAMHADRFATIPAWVIYARLPLQFLLIAWAGVYAGRTADVQRV